MFEIIKTIYIFGLAMIPIWALGMYLSQYLENQPTSNKFRQWWSRNVVDLDDLYCEEAE